MTDPQNQHIRRAHSADPMLINIKKVALMLGVDQRTIYRRVKAGDMPAPVKIGHLTRWRLAELQSWCEAGCPSVREMTGGDK